MTETSDSEIVSTRQRRIAQLAKQMPEKGLTSLNQLLDLAWLREAYRRTRKDGRGGGRPDGRGLRARLGGQPPGAPGNARSRASTGAPPVRRV